MASYAIWPLKCSCNISESNDSIFQTVMRKYVLVFFDDILVYSANWGDHLKHLESVLQILQQHTLFAKLSKCSFGLIEVDYLGIPSQAVE